MRLRMRQILYLCVTMKTDSLFNSSWTSSRFFLLIAAPLSCLSRSPVCSGSIVVTTLDCGPRGSWFKSRVGTNILWGLRRAYPSLHSFGVVHWVPVLSNIKTATGSGCESNRQLQLWTVFAGTVVNNYLFNGVQGWAGQLCQIRCRAVI